jgi:hypothetical protein
MSFSFEYVAIITSSWCRRSFSDTAASSAAAAAASFAARSSGVSARSTSPVREPVLALEFLARLVHRLGRERVVVMDLALLVDPAIKLRLGLAAALPRPAPRPPSPQQSLAVHAPAPVTLLP